MRAIGEAAARDRIFYGIPDVLGAERSRYAGRRVLVVGSGHSALNALLELAQLAAEERRHPHHVGDPPDDDWTPARRSAPGSAGGTRETRFERARPA